MLNYLRVLEMILGAYYYNRSNINVPIECMICMFNVDVTH